MNQCLSEKVRDSLCADINSGKFDVGCRLPSERKLEEEYGVSRVTINRALSMLVARGIVERRRGAGTFVADAMPYTKEKKSIPQLVKFISESGIKEGDIYVSSGHHGMHQGLKQHGQEMMLSYYSNEEEYISELLSLKNHDLAGALIWHKPSKEGDNILKELQRDRVPFVLVDNYIEDFDCDHVTSDNISGAHKMVDYLASLGHRDIFYISKDLHGFTSLKNRQLGFLQGMIDNTLPLQNEPVRYVAEYEKKDIEKAVKGIFSEGNRPTALFVSNDMIAFIVYECLKEMGLRVPDDVTLVGFDDIDRSEYFEVPLTTVKQNFFEIGLRSAKVLNERLRQPDCEFFHNIKIETALVERKSAAAPKA